MDWKYNKRAVGTSVLWALLTNVHKQTLSSESMANMASFTAVLDEVAGMEELLVDFPCVKELLTNLRKLQSSEAMQLEWFFSMLKRKVSPFFTMATVHYVH